MSASVCEFQIMIVKAAQRAVGKIAAVLGVIQGLAWTVLCLICIVLYNKSRTTDSQPESSYNEYIQNLLFHQYLSDPIFEIQAVIRPFDFAIFTWVYYFLSVGWLVASLDLFVAIHFNKKRQSLLMVIWGAVTTAVSIIDLVFTGLLARDYTACSEEDLHRNACYLTVGIMMTLAARGYTLWVINTVFAGIMISTAREIIRTDNLVREDHYKIPRAKIPFTNSTLERPNQWNENIYSTSMNSPTMMMQNPAFMNKPNNVFY